MRKILASFALVTLTLAGCGDFACENEVGLRVQSPDGRLDAVVFNRNCGATTGVNTQLSIVPSGQLTKDAGNTLVLDGAVPIKLTWQSSGSLSVSGLGQTRVFRKLGRAHGVAISYSE